MRSGSKGGCVQIRPDGAAGFRRPPTRPDRCVRRADRAPEPLDGTAAHATRTRPGPAVCPDRPAGATLTEVARPQSDPSPALDGSPKTNELERLLRQAPVALLAVPGYLAAHVGATLRRSALARASLAFGLAVSLGVGYIGSSGASIPTAVASVPIQYAHGYVNPPLAAGAVLGVLVGSNAGLRLGGRARAKWLKLLMAAVLAAVSIVYFLRSV